MTIRNLKRTTHEEKGSQRTRIKKRDPKCLNLDRITQKGIKSLREGAENETKGRKGARRIAGEKRERRWRVETRDIRKAAGKSTHKEARKGGGKISGEIYP